MKTAIIPIIGVHSRRFAVRLLQTVASAEPFADQKIAWRAHSHPINRRSQHDSEIAFVQGQQHVALGRQRGNQHRLVFGGGEQQRLLAGQRIGNPLDPGPHGRPSHGRFRAEFSDVLTRFRAAVAGRNQAPAPVGGQFRDQPGQRFLRSAGGKQHAAIQENPHALPAFLQKFSASFSSSSIQLRKVSSGISRTGSASAGCRKIPPSRSSTSIIGCSVASRPNFRRMSGGRVIVPRLDTGILVMLQYCNAAMRLSSGDQGRPQTGGSILPTWSDFFPAHASRLLIFPSSSSAASSEFPTPQPFVQP